jgi:hypothetical protein
MINLIRTILLHRMTAMIAMAAWLALTIWSLLHSILRLTQIRILHLSM